MPRIKNCKKFEDKNIKKCYSNVMTEEKTRNEVICNC